MRKIAMPFLLFLLLLNVFQLKEAHSANNPGNLLGVFYYNRIFGHVHQLPNKYSNTKTTLACGHPVKVYVNKKLGSEWQEVKVGIHKGFLLKKFLSDKRPNCFQNRFPKFFNNFELDLSELYYWGRLYDQFVEGKSKVQ